MPVTPGRFASAWPELIIACDVTGVVYCRQTDRRTDVTTGYILRHWRRTQKIQAIIILTNDHKYGASESLCVWSPTFCLYSLNLTTEGWPGWVWVSEVFFLETSPSRRLTVNKHLTCCQPLLKKSQPINELLVQYQTNCRQTSNKKLSWRNMTEH